MADLALLRFTKTCSAAAGRALVKRLREAALAVLPKDGRQGKVGTIGGARFKITLRTGQGTVDAQGAWFDLDEPDVTVIQLIYELAKAGGMAWVDSWGSVSTIVFDQAALKTLPAELRRPRPAVCTSVKHLARMMGLSLNEVAPTTGEKPWTTVDRASRYKLPGLDAPAQERYVYIQIMPDENVALLMKRLWAFIRKCKKEGKLHEPKGGGISFNNWDNWQLRLPAGQVMVPWHVTGYESRVNKDHLIPANLETWLSIADDFARASRRRIATVLNGEALVVRGGGRYPINQLEYRRFDVD